MKRDLSMLNTGKREQVIQYHLLLDEMGLLALFGGKLLCLLNQQHVLGSKLLM